MFDLPIWTVFTVSPFSGEPSLYQPAAWHRIPGRGDLPAIEAFFKLKGCTVPAAFACLWLVMTMWVRSRLTLRLSRDGVRLRAVRHVAGSGHVPRLRHVLG